MPGIGFGGSVSISFIEKLFPREKTVTIEKRGRRLQNRGRANETERRTKSKLRNTLKDNGEGSA